MICKIKKNLKRYKILRIIYRELYRIWKEFSVLLFASFLKKINLKVITRSSLLINWQKYDLREFGLEEIVKFGDFYTLEPIPKRITCNIYPMKVKIVKPFVCEIQGVEIIGNYPVAFDRDRNLILETTLPRFFAVEAHIAQNVSIKTIIASQFSQREPKPSIEIACLLVNPWSNNFWHWTVDTLTQLEGIEYYERQTGNKPKLIVPSGMRSWQKDSLQLLDYEEKDWIIWQDFRRNVDKLIVPSFRRSYQEAYKEVSVAACRWLSQKILSNLDSTKNSWSFSSKVFISRRKALGRRIINETELIESLEPLGFKTYLLEEMSYEDQVKLFAGANVIVSPHGAGLTNILFGKNLTILELFGAYIGTEFANLARSLNFKYGCLYCPPPRGEIRHKDGDMVVNTTEVLKLLDKMK